MRIKGFQKLSLLDYPGLLAATIFTGGCNFRCGFCHNPGLVLKHREGSDLDIDKILITLDKRKKILRGICITGGEPLLQDDLDEFILAVKNMGYLIKLDTNGSFPDKLKLLIDKELINYVAMDIKNSLDKYNLTAGINVNTELIERSINILKENKIPYEFRTTTIKEQHTKDDFMKIGQLLKGSSRYYLQAFNDSNDIITPGLHAHTKNEMLEFKSILEQYIDFVALRGLD